MKLRVLVFINALAVAITVSAVNYYFKHSWYDVSVTFVLTLIISFVTVTLIFTTKTPEGEMEKTGGYRLWFRHLTSGHQV